MFLKLLCLSIDQDSTKTEMRITVLVLNGSYLTWHVYSESVRNLKVLEFMNERIQGFESTSNRFNQNGLYKIIIVCKQFINLQLTLEHLTLLTTVILLMLMVQNPV